MKSLIDDVKNNISGDVLENQNHVVPFSNDESIFSIPPQIVVQPRTIQDVEKIVQIATEHKVPLTARGGGSGIAGQSIGEGVVVDFSKSMRRILEVSENHVWVEPGVVLKVLNEELAKKKKKFAPDPGSKGYCTIGGMVSTNAAGPRAMIHGSTRDHVMDLDTVLWDGHSYLASGMDQKFSFLRTQIMESRERIQKAQRKVEKNSSGYDLLSIANQQPAYEKLFVGSEGTLGLITKAKLKIVGVSEVTHFAVFTFPSLKRAVCEVEEIRKFKPASIELLNENILQIFRKLDPAFLDELKMSNAGAALWVEWENEIPMDMKNACVFTTTDDHLIQKIGAERSMVSKYLHKQAETEHRKPLRCIEDACLPINKMGNFVDEVMCTLIYHDCEGPIFGHVGSGHFHINPNIRIDTPHLTERIHALMDEFYSLVLELGGTISGEHGDGILRAKYAHAQWKDIWDLFELVKHSFDPHGIFNPDKKVPVRARPWPNFRTF